MPLIRMAGLLVYYAHVPKCGGTAISVYLTDRFGPLAFSDRKYRSMPLRRRWNRSSPQHIPVENLDRLFPEGFFDASFAMVRHPVDRLASVFLFQKETEKTVPRGTGFSDWLQGLEARRRHPFLYDNHIRPMTDLVPPGAQVFRLEQGMAPLIRWIDTIAGTPPDTPREIAPANQRALRVQKNPRLEASLRLGAGDRSLIARVYAADYDRFGYSPDDPTLY